MDNRRRTDTEAYTRFRPSRFIKDGGNWYFSTREGTLEGPFAIKPDAEDRLKTYIKVMDSGLMSRGSTLSIQPLDGPKL